MALSILMKAKQVGVSTTVVAIDIVAIYDDSLGIRKKGSAFIQVFQHHFCWLVQDCDEECLKLSEGLQLA